MSYRCLFESDIRGHGVTGSRTFCDRYERGDAMTREKDQDPTLPLCPRCEAEWQRRRAAADRVISRGIQVG